ncbi:hypothetical protein HDU96_003340, partial [Phlyctochytrium bullatum]
MVQQFSLEQLNEQSVQSTQGSIKSGRKAYPALRKTFYTWLLNSPYARWQPAFESKTPENDEMLIKIMIAYIIAKCDPTLEGRQEPHCKAGTANSFLSAMKWHFTGLRQMKTWDNALKKGNPAFCLQLNEQVKTLRRAEKQSRVAVKRALEFTYTYLKEMTSFFSEATVSPSPHRTAKCMLINVSYAVTAERTVQARHERSANEEPVPPGQFRIRPKFRKTSQYDDVGYPFAIFDELQHGDFSAMKPATNLRSWLRVRDSWPNNGRAGLVFPKMKWIHTKPSSQPLFFPNEEMDTDTFVNMVNAMLTLAFNEEVPKITGHSFRRGGAQFRSFEYVPAWKANEVARWGGWEDAGEMHKYLLEAQFEKEKVWDPSTLIKFPGAMRVGRRDDEVRALEGAVQAVEGGRSTTVT